MKKKLFLTFIISLFSLAAFSQVGINTETPSATFDIVTKGNTNSTKALEINNSSAVEMVTVLNNGNVGINTLNPSNALHINSTANPLRLQGVQTTASKIGTLVADNTGVVKLQNAATVSAASASGTFVMATNNAEQSISGVNTEDFDNLNELSGNVFTAANDGVYMAALTVQFRQGSSPAYGGDGYMGFSYINTSGTGSTSTTGIKITYNENGGGPTTMGVTNTAIFKLTAGQNISFTTSTFGADGLTNLGGNIYRVSISRVD